MVAATKPDKHRPVYTAEDLERLSTLGFRYELMRGELIEMPPAGLLQGVYTQRLASRAEIFIEDQGLGDGVAAETGFRIHADPDTVFAPDFAFIAKGKLPSPIPKGFAALAPDVVLETRSPPETMIEAR